MEYLLNKLGLIKIKAVIALCDFGLHNIEPEDEYDRGMSNGLIFVKNSLVPNTNCEYIHQKEDNSQKKHSL